MKTPVDEFAAAVERLSDKIAELESRILALEERSHVIDQHLSRVTAHPAVPATEPPSLPSAPPGLSVAIFGRVFLGIAGAYLLRALAESGVVPQAAVVPVALAYAVGWMVWATMSRGPSIFARAAGALTAALILSPMLWELTLRFQILSPRMSAAVLAVFVTLAFALAWKRDLPVVVGIASVAATATTLGLLVATRNPAPFVGGLLVMAVSAEIAGCLGRWTGLRWIPGLALDLGVCALILIYTRQGGTSEEYVTLLSPVLLSLVTAGFVIYAASTALRTAVRQQRISVFEIGQTVATFLLATTGILRITNSATSVMGFCCLFAAALSYFAAFRRNELFRRNYHVFATWAAALFLLGSFWIFPEPLGGLWLAMAALVAIVTGVRSARSTLSFHGAAYMFAAAVASGLIPSAVHILAGSPPFVVSWTMWITAAVALATYVLTARVYLVPDPWDQRVLRFVLAALVSLAVVAAGVILIVLLLVSTAGVGGALMAVVRTLVFSFAAFALAMAGSRWKRIELVWLAYIFMALCALKLIIEDLATGKAASIATSLFFYGLAWVLVPRVVRANAH